MPHNAGGAICYIYGAIVGHVGHQDDRPDVFHSIQLNT